MRLTLWKAPKGYETALTPALARGAAANGDEIMVKSTDEYRGPEGDGGIIFGVVKREILWDHQAKGRPLLYVDKGYPRMRARFGPESLPKWWRLCWQDVHPTAYLMDLSAPADRQRKLQCQLREPVEKSAAAPVALIGSSQKFHHTMRIEHPTEWAERVVVQVRAATPRPVLYRPKQSWKFATPIEGSQFDHGKKTDIGKSIWGAFCTITYGSLGCIDSIAAGVPCIVLGNAVARPICSNTLGEIAAPYWPSRPLREQWLANLAYCMFTPAELMNGRAWKILKGQMRHAFG